MDTYTIIQALINGLLMGGIYALVACGLTLIYGVMRITNFAHGEFLMLGMYFTFYLFTLLGIDPYLSIIIVAVLMFLIGMLIQSTLIERVLDAPSINQILLTVGLSLILANLALVLFSADNRVVNVGYGTSKLYLGEITINVTRLIAFISAIVVSLSLYLYLEKTRTGKAIRASSQNRIGANLVGINVKKINMIAFALGTASAGIAGSLITPFFYITPSVGQVFSLTAFVVVVLGSMGNFIGALIGGIIIGIAESLGGIFIKSSMKQFITFAIFILVLILKPEGLFGKKKYE